MLRRGTDSDGSKRRRADVLDVAALAQQDGGSSTTAADPGAPPAAAYDPIDGWDQIVSFQGLDAPLIAEMARATMGSGGVLALQSGEVAVGAMLASLAIRGHDDLVGQLIFTGRAELRLHRYATGELEPVHVHRMRSVADSLRALAWCAATGAEDTFELVADDGTGPVAIGAARHHELRWLQPPPPSSPHGAPWAEVTSDTAPPGADPGWWRSKLTLGRAAREQRPTPGGVEFDWRDDAPPFPLPSVTPSSFTGAGASGPVLVGDADRAPGAIDPAALYDAVAVSVNQALSEALVELEIDPAAIEQLRENPALDDTLAKVQQIEQHLLHLGPLNRQIHELTTIVEDLHDTMRSIVRQQWESAPPQNYWSRSQRGNDELQRAIDDLASELRSRLPRSLTD